MFSSKTSFLNLMTLTTQPHKWYPFVEMGQVEKKPQMVSKTFKNALYKVKVAFVG